MGLHATEDAVPVAVETWGFGHSGKPNCGQCTQARPQLRAEEHRHISKTYHAVELPLPPGLGRWLPSSLEKPTCTVQLALERAEGVEVRATTHLRPDFPS